MITVILADDHPVVRDGLCFLLNAQPDIKVVGTADNGHEAVQLAEKLNPNVAVRILPCRQRELRVGSVAGEKGNLELTRLQDGTLDLMALVPAVPKGPEDKAAPEQPWVATLGKLALEQFAVRVRDLALAAPVSHTVEKIRVTGENISTGKGQKGKLSLSLLLNQRTDVSARSTFSIDPLQVDGLLEVKRLPLRPYAPYYQDRILFEVEGGEAEVQTEYRFSNGGAGAEIRLAELSSSVAGLKLQKKGEPEPMSSKFPPPRSKVPAWI